MKAKMISWEAYLSDYKGRLAKLKYQVAMQREMTFYSQLRPSPPKG